MIFILKILCYCICFSLHQRFFFFFPTKIIIEASPRLHGARTFQHKRQKVVARQVIYNLNKASFSHRHHLSLHFTHQLSLHEETTAKAHNIPTEASNSLALSLPVSPASVFFDRCKFLYQVTVTTFLSCSYNICLVLQKINQRKCCTVC